MGAGTHRDVGGSGRISSGEVPLARRKTGHSWALVAERGIGSGHRGGAGAHDEDDECS